MVEKVKVNMSGKWRGGLLVLGLLEEKRERTRRPKCGKCSSRKAPYPYTNHEDCPITSGTTKLTWEAITEIREIRLFGWRCHDIGLRTQTAGTGRGLHFQGGPETGGRVTRLHDRASKDGTGSRTAHGMREPSRWMRVVEVPWAPRATWRGVTG